MATVVQSINGSLGPGNSNISFNFLVNNGNSIIVALAVMGGTPGTLTVSDAVNGVYNFGTVNINLAHIKNKRSVTGGFTQLNITSEFGDTSYYVVAWEVSGLDNSAAIPDGTGSDPGGTLNHNTLDAGISGTGFAVAVNTYSTSGGNTTPGVGWTLGTPITGTGTIIQRKIDAFVNDTGQFTTSLGTSSIGAMAIFPDLDTGALPFLTTIGAMYR